MNVFNIFISHAGKDDIRYKTIEKWLDDEMKSGSDFKWINCSFNKKNDEDIQKEAINKRQLKPMIKERIYFSSLIIIISDMYADNKKIIDFEIDTARRLKKYIIALRAWRNLYPTPKKIAKHADMIINMNNRELVGAVKQALPKA